MVGIQLATTQIERESDAGDVLHATLEDCSHRAAVVYADAGVVAVVDATQDEVGATRHDALAGELHAIHRTARAGEHRHCSTLAAGRDIDWSHGSSIYAVEAHRPDAGDATGSTRAWAVGGYDIDISEMGYGSGQRGDAVGSIAIVVGDEYERTHLLGLNGE